MPIALRNKPQKVRIAEVTRTVTYDYNNSLLSLSDDQRRFIEKMVARSERESLPLMLQLRIKNLLVGSRKIPYISPKKLRV